MTIRLWVMKLHQGGDFELHCLFTGGILFVTKMAHQKKTLGKDAIVLILLKYIHPSEHIRNKYINPLPKQALQFLCVKKSKRSMAETSLLLSSVTPNLWMGILQ